MIEVCKGCRAEVGNAMFERSEEKMRFITEECVIDWNRLWHFPEL